MEIPYWLGYLYERRIGIGIQCILTFLTYVLVKYQYKRTSQDIKLAKVTKEKLIESFEPLPIAEASDKNAVKRSTKDIKANFCNYDVFNLGKKYKDEIKAAIREYGIGTCGPRGFYGTLDIHLELEKQIAELFNKDKAILYSNYLVGLQSIIPCFCRVRSNVYVHENASEAIFSGIQLSGANIHTYRSLSDLPSQLEAKITDKYLIVEKIGKNTGQVTDIKQIVQLKKEHGFRIILDEAYSIPFVYQRPPDIEDYGEVDVVVGSLCLGYPTNGGFCATCARAIDYQELTGCGYVFSASLPGFLVVAAMAMIRDPINYEKIRERTKTARKKISGVVSTEETPVLLIGCADINKKLNELEDAGYVAGRCGEYIRICVNEETKDSDLDNVEKILAED